MRVEPQKITSRRGSIRKLDFQTARGRILLEGGDTIDFHLTTYNSGRPKRRAAVGMLVTVTFADGEVLCVDRLPN